MHRFGRPVNCLNDCRFRGLDAPRLGFFPQPRGAAL